MYRDEENNSGFIGRLEALRGIAALWVAVGHSVIWLSIGPVSGVWSDADKQTFGVQALIRRLITYFFNGNAAVDIFFVLSGFVLARSIYRSTRSIAGYAEYATRRLARIVPALWFSLAIICAYLAVLFPGYAVMPGASNWFNGWFVNPLNWATVVDNATFVTPWLNPNAWTLRIEVLASLLLPAVVLLMGSKGWSRTFVVLGASLVVGWIYRGDNLSLLHYLYMFVAGAVIAKHGRSYSRALSERRELIAASCVAAIVLSNALLEPHSIEGDAVIVAASVGLIWSISFGVRANVLAALDARWSAFLGRISYSFYLLHFIVLYTVANFLLHVIPAEILIRWPLFVMLAGGAVSIAIAIPFAWLSFSLIEQPFVRIGKRISAPGRTAFQVD